MHDMVDFMTMNSGEKSKCEVRSGRVSRRAGRRVGGWVGRQVGERSTWQRMAKALTMSFPDPPGAVSAGRFTSTHKWSTSFTCGQVTRQAGIQTCRHTVSQASRQTSRQTSRQEGRRKQQQCRAATAIEDKERKGRAGWGRVRLGEI